MYRTLSAPVAVQWEVTGQCTKNCIHCANYWRDKSQFKTVVEPQLETIYDRVTQEIISNQVMAVTITGGEPLLIFPAIKPYISSLVSAKISVSFNSNLAPLSPEMAKELWRSGIRSILTSVPSSDPETDYRITNSSTSFRNTARGIGIALEQGFRVTANMVVSKRNLHQVYSTAQYVKSMGITNFTATKASKPSNCEDFSKELLSLSGFRFMAQELLRVKYELGLDVDTIQAYPACAIKTADIKKEIAGFNRTCTGAKSFCMIGFDGRVRPCPLSSDFYGNVLYEGGLRGAWYAMDPWRTDAYLPMECAECPAKTTCSGGCKADAKHINGSYNSIDPYCDLTEKPVLARRETDLSIPSRFRFNSKLRTREEDFGGILFLSNNAWLGVSVKLLILAKYSAIDFSINSFATALGNTSENIKPTVLALLNRNILHSVN